MASKYYRRRWDESRGDAWDSWGRCVYLFEVGADGRAVRQVEQYEDGPTLRYGEGHDEDEHGFLTSEPFPTSEWAPFEVSGEAFADGGGVWDNRLRSPLDHGGRTVRRGACHMDHRASHRISKPVVHLGSSCGDPSDGRVLARRPYQIRAR